MCASLGYQELLMTILISHLEVSDFPVANAAVLRIQCVSNFRLVSVAFKCHRPVAID